MLLLLGWRLCDGMSESVWQESENEMPAKHIEIELTCVRFLFWLGYVSDVNIDGYHVAARSRSLSFCRARSLTQNHAGAISISNARPKLACPMWMDACARLCGCFCVCLRVSVLVWTQLSMKSHVYLQANVVYYFFLFYSYFMFILRVR